MTTETKLIKNKLGLLKLGEQLGNVSQACKMMGYSRDSFYRIKELYNIGGEAGLREISRKKPIIKNRVDPEVEEACIAIAIEQPAWGQMRASNELKKRGIFISPAGLRCVWVRNDLERFSKRLKALETKLVQDGSTILTDAQLMAMEKKREKAEASGEIETEHPGYLGCQDTYYVGNIKGVGRIYQQTFIDSYSKLGICKLYDQKHAIVAGDILNDRVVPFFEEYKIPLLRMLTDRGTEYKGRPDKHEYELYLQLEGIEHSKTQVKRPQSNGICERFHRTIQEEFYANAFRRKLYPNLFDLQCDLDEYIKYYNEQRPHTGRYCYGKTPMQTFIDSLPLAKEKMLNNQHDVY